MQPLLQIEDLNVQFDTDIQRINALNDVSLHINKGEIVGIIGASGSGKSTLAKSILGLWSNNQETKGKITLNAANEKIELISLNPEEWLKVRRANVSMVFQNPLLNLNPALSIGKHFKNVTQGDQAESVVHTALEHVGLGNEMTSILEAYPHQLSGGQQQRILIALAMTQQTDLLILDEPMASLDRANQEGIEKILRSLVSQGMAIVFITHDLQVVSRLADRIYVIDDGVIVETGESSQIMERPQHAYTEALVRAIDLGKRTSIANDQSIILDASNVSHIYKKGGFLTWKPQKIQALTDVSLTIKKGSIVGLVGPSGSGKSTLVKILLGVEQLQDGNIEIEGKSISKYSNMVLKKMIQLIPQNTADALNPKLILEDQLRDVHQVHNSSGSDFKKVIASLFQDVELNLDLLSRFPSELSGGEIQRMAIVRALLIRPRILVLDESLSALDMLIQKKTLSLIHSLNEKLGMTIILISHDARLISHSCDEIYHFSEGVVRQM